MDSYDMAGNVHVQAVMQIPEGVSAPNLRTILMVEKTLAESEYGELSFAALKRALPKQVNHNELKLVVQYLQYNGKVVVGVKGITWTGGTRSPFLTEVMAHGRRV